MKCCDIVCFSFTQAHTPWAVASWRGAETTASRWWTVQNALLESLLEWNGLPMLILFSPPVSLPAPHSLCPFCEDGIENLTRPLSRQEKQKQRSKKKEMGKKQWNRVKSPARTQCVCDSRGLTQRSLASHPASPSVLFNWKVPPGERSTCWGENWGPWTDAFLWMWLFGQVPD